MLYSLFDSAITINQQIVATTVCSNERKRFLCIEEEIIIGAECRRKMGLVFIEHLRSNFTENYNMQSLGTFSRNSIKWKKEFCTIVGDLSKLEFSTWRVSLKSLRKLSDNTRIEKFIFGNNIFFYNNQNERYYTNKKVLDKLGIVHI